jgi:hypothetical protein
MAFDPAEYTGRREREQAQADAQAQTAGFDPAAYLGQASPTSVPTRAQPVYDDLATQIVSEGAEFAADKGAQLLAPAATASQVQIVPKTFPVSPQAGGVGPPSRVGFDVELKPQGYNPTAIREALEPLRKVVPSTVSQYMATPSKLLTDVAIPAMTGIPITPFAGYNIGKAALELPGAVSESADIMSRYTSAADPNAYRTTGQFPEQVSAYRDLNARIKQLDRGFSDQMGDILRDTRGGGNKVLEFLKNVPEKIAQDPKFQQRLQAFQEAMPSGLQQAGRVAAPVLRTAARVAGPVGMAMDIADASQFAHEAELGSRLASGQGRNAQQAFRNMARTQQYGGLTPQEQAILEQDRIDQDIRRKAASRVLGPIAPGM